MIESEFQSWIKDQMMPSDDELVELEHHGIKGMKWGVRRTPEQLGHKTGGKKKRTGIFAKAKKKRAKAKKAKAAKEAKKEAESDEKAREKALNSTDPKYIYKNRHLLTTKELQDRITRINTEDQIRKLTVDDKAKKSLKKGEETLKTIGSMAESVSKIAKAYDSIADAKSKQEKRIAEKEQKLAEEARKRAEASKPKPTERDIMMDKLYKEFESRGEVTSTIPMSALDAYKIAKGSYVPDSWASFTFNPTTGAVKFDRKKKR